MSNDKKIYTFEDWQNGNTLPTQFPEGDKVSLYEINTSQLLRPEEKDDLPLALYKLNRMKKEDFKKVRKKQRKAYKILLNAYIDKAINKINSYDNEEEKKRYMRKRKAFIENWMEDVSSNIISRFNEDNLDLKYFTGKTCKSILDSHEKGKTVYLSKRNKIKADPTTDKELKRYRVSESFEYQILLAELKEIEGQLNSSDNQSAPSKKRLIKEFASKFAKRANYSEETIYSYLVHWDEYHGVSYPRASAKRELEKEDITLPEHDNTLKNWEESWLEFFYSRTAK